MEFHATVELGGKTATGIRVPPEVVEALGAGKKPAVSVTIGSHTYRTTIASRSDLFLLPLSAENRTAAGVSAGDEVDVRIELDTAPRVLAVPADFQAALDADPPARAVFDGLSYSRRQRLVLPVEGAKAAETRQRRIDKAMVALREGTA